MSEIQVAAYEVGNEIILLGVGLPEGEYEVVSARSFSQGVLTDGEGNVAWSALHDGGAAVRLALKKTDIARVAKGETVTVTIDGKELVGIFKNKGSN